MIYITEVSLTMTCRRPGNRHLVITTDASKATLRKALKNVFSPNAEDDPISKVCADFTAKLKQRGVIAPVEAAEYVF